MYSHYFRANLFAALAFLVVLCAAAGLVGCKDPVVPSNHIPTSCSLACDNAARLCGPDALKPKTGTCGDVCKATEEGGGDYRTGCLSSAKTCETIRVCSK